MEQYTLESPICPGGAWTLTPRLTVRYASYEVSKLRLKTLSTGKLNNNKMTVTLKYILTKLAMTAMNKYRQDWFLFKISRFIAPRLSLIRVPVVSGRGKNWVFYHIETLPHNDDDDDDEYTILSADGSHDTTLHFKRCLLPRGAYLTPNQLNSITFSRYFFNDTTTVRDVSLSLSSCT